VANPRVFHQRRSQQGCRGARDQDSVLRFVVRGSHRRGTRRPNAAASFAQAAQKAAQTAFALFLTKLLIAKLWEGWHALHDNPIGPIIGRLYLPKIRPETREKNELLGKRFGKIKWLADLRNTHVFR
jgi:hypothetical protein